MNGQRQRGVLLISMIFLMLVIATIGMLLNRENLTAVQSRGTNFNISIGRNVAEAGLRHIQWQLNSNNCANYKNLPATNFITDPGSDASKNWSYSATVNPTGGSPVNIVVTASGPDSSRY